MSEVSISSAPTFERYCNNIEAYAVECAEGAIREYARELGADRVYITKNKCGAYRPVALRFMLRSRFIRNESLNSFLSVG